MKLNIASRLKKIHQWLLYFLYTQTIVTLIAFPVLVSWGLGMSYMTFVGNLIFTPMLCGFLLVSSLIFFTELLTLPNGFLVIALEHLTNWWHWSLSLGNESWIIYFAKPPTWTLFVVPLLTLWIMRTSAITSLNKRLAASTAFLGIIIVLSLTWTHLAARRPIKIFLDNKFIIENTKNGVRAIDSGFLNRKKAAEKFIEFELKPQLIAQFGTPVIDELSLLKPGSGSFAAAAALCSCSQIKKIMIPYFKPFESKYAWAQFFAMRSAAQEKGVKIQRI